MDSVKPTFKSANIAYSLNTYASGLLVTSVIISILMFFIAALIFSLVLPTVMLFTSGFVLTIIVFIFSLVVGVLSGAITFIIFYYYP
ncbi:MAG: hypothetical protein KAS30_05815, partial [Candidatus Diapherotrites archaeon]|nr:hypothetical protein [Candidatus Diapherotrites archaeon]